MNNYQARIIVAGAACSSMFGMWQHSFYAAMWMMGVILLVLAAIDYAKDTP